MFRAVFYIRRTRKLNPLYEANPPPDDVEATPRVEAVTENFPEKTTPVYVTRSQHRCYCVVLLLVGVLAAAALVIALLTALNIVNMGPTGEWVLLLDVFTATEGHSKKAPEGL